MIDLDDRAQGETCLAQALAHRDARAPALLSEAGRLLETWVDLAIGG